MRILKSFAVQDEKTERVSRIFDRIVTTFDYPWKFSRLELHIRDENKLLLKDDACIMVLDYNDPLIQQSDSKGIAILVLRTLFKAIYRESHGEAPEAIEDIAINREMVKKGYGNDLAYYYYTHYYTHRAKGPLKDDIAWLSFHLQDKYNAELFRNKKPAEERKEAIESLKRDLEDQHNMRNAIRNYMRIGAK